MHLKSVTTSVRSKVRQGSKEAILRQTQYIKLQRSLLVMEPHLFLIDHRKSLSSPEEVNTSCVILIRGAHSVACQHPPDETS